MAKFLVHKLRIWQVLTVLTVLLGCLTLSGFMGRLWWPFEMTSHFRIQYFVLLGLFSFVFLIGKKRRAGFLTSAFALINLFLIVPPTIESQASIPEERHLRTLAINLHYHNIAYDKVKSLIRQTKPDLLLLTEYLPRWKKELKEMLNSYPYSKVSPLKNGWALGFYSRVPTEEIKIIRLGNVPIPVIEAKINIGQKSLTLIGAHLQDPSSPTRLDVRNRQLSGLSRHLQKTNGPIMVLGDLNVSPWSPHFIDLIQQAGLHGPNNKWVWLPTWPTYFFPLQIPLDYCLASKDIVFHKYERGPDIGSDHYPIIVDFSLLESTSPATDLTETAS